MTSRGAMTAEDMLRHGTAIGAAETEEQFVVAFSAYVQDVLIESDPVTKIATFVYLLIEGQREVINELVRLQGGGSA